MTSRDSAASSATKYFPSRSVVSRISRLSSMLSTIARQYSRATSEISRAELSPSPSTRTRSSTGAVSTFFRLPNCRSSSWAVGLVLALGTA